MAWGRAAAGSNGRQARCDVSRDTEMQELGFF